MSGIEVAGLVVGIVPIFAEILKSYSATKRRLKAFTHFAHVIYDVQLRYQVAAANFSNNCQLLLQAVIQNAHEVPEMLKDPAHDSWRNPTLEEQLRNFLERDYQLCEGIVVRIRDALRETQVSLSKLEQDPSAASDSPLRTTQRFSQAFNIARKENHYRRHLEEIDDWNEKLSNMRKQRCKLQKRQIVASGCLIRKAAPRKYSEIRIASQRLSESLHDSWTCTNVSHSEHRAKLSLDATAEYGTVQLDMVIACRRKAVGAHQIPPSESPIWLHVRSVTTYAPIPNPVLQSSASANTSVTALQTNIHFANAVMPKPSRQGHQHSSKKRVSFVVDERGRQARDLELVQPKRRGSSKASYEDHAQSFAMLDLKATKSVCCHLSRACSSLSTCPDTCLGYLEKLEVPHSFKLIFYDASKLAAEKPGYQGAGREALPVKALLQNLETLHKLTLAHRLATATLQYHSTAWLPQDWNLQDVAYFADNSSHRNNEISKKLESLHLSTQFPGESHVALVPSRQDPSDLKYMYGIKNLTLAKLGVAMIEICLGNGISSLSVDPTMHDVISARKILLEKPHSLDTLGIRYVEIVRKCIDCSFSCGDNLSEDDLQSAVYTEVVCALEDMITHWKSFFGIK